jgi:hypothetical protein
MPAEALVRTTMRPPPSTASRALERRLRRTCWSFPRCPRIAGSAGSSTASSAILRSRSCGSNSRTTSSAASFNASVLERGPLGAGQVEQRVRDARRATRLLLDLAQRGVPRVVRGGLLEEELSVAADPRERRVDLMRDAGGQKAERREALLLLHLLLEHDA